MKFVICIAILLFIQTSIGFSAGPNQVAKAHQNLWPAKIDSPKSFSVASRSEILVFLKSYSDLLPMLKAEDLGVKKMSAVSIEAWKKQFEKFWLNNFLEASKDCGETKSLGCGFRGTSFSELLVYAREFVSGLPKEYSTWLAMSSSFFDSYVREQARLAALFPNPTSEILPLAESEIFGNKFKDGEFLLTFDDGPTAKGGHTEKYVELLKKENISAYFFVLGNALSSRLTKSSVSEVGQLYSGQCLASHGFEHKSHQTWSSWSASLDKTKDLIRSVYPEKPVPFRPPYGQRSAELISKQEKDISASVILWNIDSQDWHSKINAGEVGDRVQKLMLIWRKGIVLFHDVHNKGLTAVPQLIEFAKSSQLNWVSCNSVK